MSSHKKYTAYICRDCEIDFQTSKSSRGGTFCPNCGENLYTQKIKDVWMPRLIMHKRPWTDEEKEEILLGVRAGYTIKQIAESFDDRTYSSVRNQWWQLRKEETDNGSDKSAVALPQERH